MTNENRAPSQHRPGDVMRTEIGELYAYLGYYEGVPRSIYARPDAGHLYMFLDSAGKPVPDDAIVLDDIVARKNINDVDGNASYTKRPKKFQTLEKHVDLAPIMTKIQCVYGLTRVGDRRPTRRDAKEAKQ